MASTLMTKQVLTSRLYRHLERDLGLELNVGDERLRVKDLSSIGTNKFQVRLGDQLFEVSVKEVK